MKQASVWRQIILWWSEVDFSLSVWNVWIDYVEFKDNQSTMCRSFILHLIQPTMLVYQINFAQLESANSPLNGCIYEYLSDRTRSVVSNGSNSIPFNVSLGVPQRSILGPHLLTVYKIDRFCQRDSISLALFCMPVALPLMWPLQICSLHLIHFRSF